MQGNISFGNVQGSFPNKAYNFNVVNKKENINVKNISKTNKSYNSERPVWALSSSSASPTVLHPCNGVSYTRL